MQCSLFSLIWGLNPVLPFQKLLVFEFLLAISEALLSSKSYPSAGCVSTDNAVCRDAGIFKRHNCFCHHTS
jgi:hypothetical protein